MPKYSKERFSTDVNTVTGLEFWEILHKRLEIEYQHVTQQAMAANNDEDTNKLKREAIGIARAANILRKPERWVDDLEKFNGTTLGPR